MRKGENISKDQLLDIIPCSHRVIIPLFIPNEEDYYEESYKVFKMCLSSVRKTSNSPIKVSVISNGSCLEVNKKLMSLYEEKAIDELIIEKENIGKINSILKALRTAEERLITITDGDVLFLNGWEQAVTDVFKAFPKAAMVSPIPVFRSHLRLTSNIWLRYLFSSRLRFRKVKNPEALTCFAKSIGWPRLDNKYKDVIATLKAKNGLISVIGNSHFVGTYKKEVFNKLPMRNSKYKLGGDSELLYTDLPVINHGGYRLATNNNYGYHMGNKIESWLLDCYNDLKEEQKKYRDFKNFKLLKSSPFSYFISEKLFKRILIYKPLKRMIFKQKGLNKEQLENFLK